jgi:hypothetical protein
VTAVAASSASAAIKISPGGKEFKGTETTEFIGTTGGAMLKCKKSSIAGTTQGLKSEETNYLNFTPTFSECKFFGASSTVSSGSCKPNWTLTLTAFSSETYWGALKLNCAMTFTVGTECTMTVPAQSETFGRLTWKNEGSPLEAKITDSPNFVVDADTRCQQLGFSKVGELGLQMGYKVPGIYAKGS